MVKLIWDETTSRHEKKEKSREITFSVPYSTSMEPNKVQVLRTCNKIDQTESN